MIKLKSMTEPESPEANIIYHHPTTIDEFEAVYKNEYGQQLESCDKWIAWCKKRDDWYGMNFHQGMRSAHIFNNIKMHQLLRVLKQEEPNKRPEATGGRMGC